MKKLLNTRHLKEIYRVDGMRNHQMNVWSHPFTYNNDYFNHIPARKLARMWVTIATTYNEDGEECNKNVVLYFTPMGVFEVIETDGCQPIYVGHLSTIEYEGVFNIFKEYDWDCEIYK